MVSGPSKKRRYNRTYNFYLSQIQIQVKISFGWLSTKWQIFRRNLDYSLGKNSTIIMVGAKLHNFVIERDNLQFNTASNLEEFGVKALVDGPDNNNGFLPSTLNQEEVNNDIDCFCQHHIVLGEIRARDMRRPLYNILQNHDSNLLEEDELDN